MSCMIYIHTYVHGKKVLQVDSVHNPGHTRKSLDIVRGKFKS